MSDPTVALSLAPIIAGLNGQVVYAAALMIALPAIAAAFGLAHVGAKFLDCAARQPEAIGPLTARLLIIAALVDAGAIMSIGIGAMIVISNPFMSSIMVLLG
jgi:F-type H+-transporting ATPase subunit c